MKLRNVILINRAPFEQLQIDFSDDNIALLSGINGAGKTTILSYIVDAIYELARSTYRNEFEDRANKFYRISSDLYSLDKTKPSIVYLRFSLEDEKNADYIDIRGNCEEAEYDRLIELAEKIPFSLIARKIKQEQVIKNWTLTSREEIEEVFSSQILAYFPAYRYESPYYLTDPYKMNLSFNKDMQFSGKLPNPIEVTTDLPQIANWIMDVVLDSELYGERTLFKQINEVISHILQSKVGEKTRIGIGPRTTGVNRIAIMYRDELKGQLYPSIFNMSSGELALLCLFIEIIKQADRIGKTAKTISGIVLIDEIEKHLHIQLQKETLPGLINLFPNIQFIASSHSPFLGLGLSDSNFIKYSLFDLDKGGVTCPPQDNDLFKEVYDIMINQNDQYFTKYKQLENKINSDTKPLIITEGKTDWKHLKAARVALEITDIDVEIFEYDETIGDIKLKQLLDDFAKIKQNRIIIGVFDRDNAESLKFEELFTAEYHNLQNNVFAFAIPLVNNEYGKEISIEHYYRRSDLTKKDSNGRRLFLGDEFCESGMSKDSKYHTRSKGIEKKVKKNGIIDNRVYDIKKDPEEKMSLALSKNDFAELILNKDPFALNFDFSNFATVFDVIRKIITEN